MNKQKIIAATITSALLFSLIAMVSPAIKDATANPFFVFNKIVPVPGTIPPNITIVSPKNGTIYSSDEITLSFYVDRPILESCNTAIIDVKYILDGSSVQAFTIWSGGSASNSWAVPVYSTTNTLRLLPLGSHNLTVTAEGVVYAGGKDIFFIGSASTIYFAVDNQLTQQTPTPTCTPSPSLKPSAPNPSPTPSLTQTITPTITSSATPTPAESPTTTSSNNMDFIVKIMQPGQNIEWNYNSTGPLYLYYSTNKPTSWVAYSIDDCENTTTMNGSELPTLSEGTHSIKLYANDTVGKAASSWTIYFSTHHEQSISIPTQEPSSSPSVPEFPSWTILAFATTSILVTIIYSRKRRDANE
jgi:hypothetical protein